MTKTNYTKLMDITIRQGEDIAVIKQRLNDMSGMIKNIFIQTKKTNGYVQNNKSEIMLLKDRQDKCPARLFHINPNSVTLKNQSIKRMAIVMVAVVTAVTIITQIILHFI